MHHKWHHCFLLIATLCFHRSHACSPPYHILHGVCVSNSSGIPEMTYCQAQEFCHGIQGQLITGNNYLPFDTQDLFDSSGNIFRFWIGLTDMLDERETSRVGWRWTDGSLTPASEHLNWGTTNPKSACYNYQCEAIIKKISLISGNRAYTRGALCEPRPKSEPDRFMITKTIPTITNTVMFADGACTRLSSQPSILACAAQCLREKQGWCVSFYFHETLEQCQIVLFTDATLQLTPPDGWIKIINM